MDDCVSQSREALRDFLESSKKGRIVVDRWHLVSYATLVALCGHFPSRSCVDDHILLKACARIEIEERDRFFKQRRIAISELSRLFHQH